ncbi:unnamed protein product [Adineta steineri]|uniref:Uncharacterized protein n=1 Tax=Adineta steineri TaxID=433720 RepID=A0A813VFG5_9BILA|nr:unnamed protein product [Adineta steineri]
MISSLKNYFRKVNIYDYDPHLTPEQRDHENHSNIIATRIFLIILIITLIIFILAFQLSYQTTIVTISNPTQEQFENLPFTAYCPCSRISISYDQFTSINVRFHQACSSDFISDRWIQSIFTGSNTTYFYLSDFRTYGSAAFQALASFCRLSKTNALQSITLFNQMSFISLETLTQSVFQSQINASIEQFQLTTPNEFKTQLNLVQEMTTHSKLQSALQTNYLLYYYAYSIWQFTLERSALEYFPSNGNSCYCISDFNCKESSKIYNIYGEATQLIGNSNSKILMRINGFKASCLPVNAILLSTLECFYNQTCMNQLISFFPTTEKFLAMEFSAQSRFTINSTVQMIVDKLMIEEWITNISYDKYFQQCAPNLCTYTKNEKYGFTFILRKIISLLGGFTLVLGFFIQLIVKFIRRLPRTEPITLCQRTKDLFQKIWRKLNMFKHHESNEHEERYQRLGTRLYIFILIITLSILSVYILIEEGVHRITILKPTETQYEHFQQIYSNKTICPCSSITMTYANFITIQPSYHQVCSSDLVSPQWILYNTRTTSGLIYTYFDYRLNSQLQFQLLAMFCQQAQQIVDNGIKTFLQTQFISSRIDSQDLFESEINLLISDWRTLILNRYLRPINIIRTISQGNLLMNSGLNNNFSITNSTNKNIKILPKIYSNCSCALSSQCMQFMAIFTQISATEFTPILEIPNFYIGCSSIESLLNSTLETFYNRSYMLEIDQYLQVPLGSSFNFSALNPKLSLPNETIETIVNRLMIDSWSSNISFSSYYQTCAPLSCTIEYIGKNNILDVITSIIGIFGGLSLGLKLFFILILRSSEKIRNNLSFIAMKTVIKNLFTCYNEQQMITRLQTFFLTISLYCIFLYSTYTTQLITVEINKPTYSIYQSLSLNYSQSLQCFCSDISIPYQSFLAIKPRFHDLCSSQFVSQDWINYLYGTGNLVYRYSFTDFRASAVGQFQLLASLCEISQETINTSLVQLLTSDYNDRQLLSEQRLDQLIQTQINQFQLVTPNSLLNNLNLIRETLGANMIISVWSVNWLIATESIINSGWTAHTKPIVYGKCNCGTSWTCTQSSQGMMVGCYPLESLLQTTLQCFYNQSCIDSTNKFTQLNISSLKTSRHQMSTTIQSILNNLMVEEYIINKSYENYFNQCAPSSCSYNYIKKYQITEGIINLISLYSGLVILTRCLSVILIKLCSYKSNRITIQITE